MGEFKLKRINGPILHPISHHPWESQAVFNPGTVCQGDIIHLLYRAVEGENFSSIGHAKLNSEGKVISRYDKPVIKRELGIEKHGCEDPRIVHFSDKYYIFYTSYDGKNTAKGENARVILAETSDFTSYHKIGMVGPDMQDKDAMIFPEKIGSRIAYLHRILPNIQLAFFDCMEHLINPEQGYWQHHLQNLKNYTVMFPQLSWEEMKIGAGPPPCRTDAGWLLIYHGVDKKSIYRAGAALLDYNNPYKVIARLPYPILEPQRKYECVGDVENVVFPEGLVLLGDKLQIYYGAADKVVALAEGSLSRLLDELWKHKVD